MKDFQDFIKLLILKIFLINDPLMVLLMNIYPLYKLLFIIQKVMI